MIATRLLQILAAVLIAPCHLRLPVTHTQVIGPVTGATRINRCWLYVVLVLVGLTPQSRSNAAPAEQIRNTETTAGRCVVIDSDAGLDDFRAIAVLAANQRVAAIVVTEGLSDPVEGSAAVEVLLARMGQKYPLSSANRLLRTANISPLLICANGATMPSGSTVFCQRRKNPPQGRWKDQRI